MGRCLRTSAAESHAGLIAYSMVDVAKAQGLQYLYQEFPNGDLTKPAPWEDLVPWSPHLPARVKSNPGLPVRVGDEPGIGRRCTSRNASGVQINGGMGLQLDQPVNGSPCVTWHGEPQFPDWRANYSEFDGQVSGPYNLSGFPDP